MKKIISGILCLITLLAFTGCGTLQESANNIKSLQLSYITENTISVEKGKTAKDSIILILDDIDSFNADDIEFVSEDSSIATVKYLSKEIDDVRLYLYFNITGIKSGETYVYAREKDGTLETEKRKIVVYDASSETKTTTAPETKPETVKDTEAVTSEIKTPETEPPVKDDTTAAPGDTETPEDTETVYWVKSGEVWHVDKNCSTLSRSTNIQSGTIEESGKSRVCTVCG